MFSRLSNSWLLLKASAAVLSADKELVIFPILSALGVLVVTLSFILPFILGNLLDSFTARGFGAAGFILLFAFYIVQYFVIFFCNTALVGAAMIRLRGGDPTVADGFRIASQKLLPILGYALIAATVGMLIRAASSKQNGIGRIVTSLIGFGWNVATFLVVPVLASEEIGPLQAIKRSVNLLKKTWGEQLAGNFGLGAVFGLAAFGLLLLGFGGIALAASANSPVLLLSVVALVLLLLVLAGLLNATLSGIYAAAVYRYAVDGETSGPFQAEMVSGAFRSER